MFIEALILLFVTYLSSVDSTLAPFITKCKWDDSKCIKETSRKAIPLFADGIPELNVERLDPVTLKHVDASTSNLKLILTDLKVTGLKDCEAKKMQRDIEKSKLTVKVLCSCDVNGKYDMNGQLFVLPIEGKGDVHVNIRKIVINVEADLIDKLGEDGKKHWDVKSWKHTFELKDKSDIKFENLFPDNELLRNTTSELIAKNGNDVITELGPPLIKAAVFKVVDSVKSFFTKVPVEDLTLD